MRSAPDMDHGSMTAAAVSWPLAAAQAPVREATPPFERVFEQFAPYVGRTLRFLGVAEANVEDVCQEVFIVVHRRLREVDSAGSLRAWIRQICVHAAQNERRRMRRRREQPSDDVARELPAPAAQHRSAELREMRERLLVLLDRLTEDQRAVFVLYEIEQLTMAEVATAVGCPLQTAYSRLHAARARIAQTLATEAP
jgi:RNA polymerase sigma-70 factor (ECF subfamily)